MQWRKPPLPALTVKLSKYNVDDVALGVCKTGAEEAGVTEVRSEERFSRNAETDLVCRLLLEKKKKGNSPTAPMGYELIGMLPHFQVGFFVPQHSWLRKRRDM